MINASQDYRDGQDLDDLIWSSLSYKMVAKCNWVLNLFATWHQDRKKEQTIADLYMFKDMMNMNVIVSFKIKF